MTETNRPFPHRRNPDGSFDSICPDCFLNVASGVDESDLKAAEAAHVCLGLERQRAIYFEDRVLGGRKQSEGIGTLEAKYTQ